MFAALCSIPAATLIDVRNAMDNRTTKEMPRGGTTTGGGAKPSHEFSDHTMNDVCAIEVIDTHLPDHHIMQQFGEKGIPLCPFNQFDDRISAGTNFSAIIESDANDNAKLEVVYERGMHSKLFRHAETIVQVQFPNCTKTLFLNVSKNTENWRWTNVAKVRPPIVIYPEIPRTDYTATDSMRITLPKDKVPFQMPEGVSVVKRDKWNPLVTLRVPAGFEAKHFGEAGSSTFGNTLFFCDYSLYGKTQSKRAAFFQFTAAQAKNITKMKEVARAIQDIDAEHNNIAGTSFDAFRVTIWIVEGKEWNAGMLAHVKELTGAFKAECCNGTVNNKNREYERRPTLGRDEARKKARAVNDNAATAAGLVKRAKHYCEDTGRNVKVVIMNRQGGTIDAVAAEKIRMVLESKEKGVRAINWRREQAESAEMLLDDVPLNRAVIGSFTLMICHTANAPARTRNHELELLLNKIYADINDATTVAGAKLAQQRVLEQLPQSQVAAAARPTGYHRSPEKSSTPEPGAEMAIGEGLTGTLGPTGSGTIEFGPASQLIGANNGAPAASPVADMSPDEDEDDDGASSYEDEDDDATSSDEDGNPLAGGPEASLRPKAKTKKGQKAAQKKAAANAAKATKEAEGHAAAKKTADAAKKRPAKESVQK
jgi:hypothetical protein